ncbi:hypothetical protein [Pseudobutyrivibrio sp.]|uniref:hypothetical protein n=1 Tax=Pseudobutyrivibrio sp. TaxID=2014367 RepID=UPI0025E9BB37|nr:hypothetical protein [Pseudobutyrivibrio sp.]MBR5648617.1 hypothetical protein [Pseudobutyrivibrio sp.]
MINKTMKNKYLNKNSLKVVLILLSIFLTSILGFKSDAKEDKDDEYWSDVIEIQKDIRHREILKYGMTPIYGRDIADGTYSVDVVSNSKYFKISEAKLVAKNGKLKAKIKIPSMSYLYVYMGTSADAAKDEDHWIDYKEVDDCTVFTIPVEALNKEIDCAAYSKARKKWYDRKLVFDASSLHEGACQVPIPDYDLLSDAINVYGRDDEAYLSQIDSEATGTDDSGDSTEATMLHGTPKPAEVDYPDGEYSIEVNMVGGSGRASVSSPTWMIVKDGKAYARLLWSSTYYDYMIVGDEVFYNLTKDGGNSVFEIPIVAFDESFPVIADTTAMGDPVEIRYELSFYSMTIGPKGNIPQVAAKKVLIIALVIISVGGILNFIQKKKKEK